MSDYRTDRLKWYVYEPYSHFCDSAECPNCGNFISTSKIETCDMYDGDYDYGICPHCGALLKLQLVPSYYFDAEICSQEEFEEETGEELSGVES